jgi:hypothetical protein
LKWCESPLCACVGLTRHPTLHTRVNASYRAAGTDRGRSYRGPRSGRPDS